MVYSCLTDYLSNFPKLAGAAPEKKVTPMIESAKATLSTGHDVKATARIQPSVGAEAGAGAARGNPHIDATTKRMTKALSTGMIDEVSAVTMLRSVLMRPKMRMMRNARMRRRMLMGRSIGPRATRDMVTTKKSNMLLVDLQMGVGIRQRQWVQQLASAQYKKHRRHARG
jgi:hypothetical protein